MKTHSISFSISVRDIAYAVLKEQRLIFWEVNAFLDPLDAVNTVAGVVRRSIERFNPGAAVLETINVNDSAVSKLHDTVKETVRQLGIPVFEISYEELSKSFGFPQLKNRHQIRKIAASLFPDMPFATFTYACLDAAARGLHFETNRLLSH